MKRILVTCIVLLLVLGCGSREKEFRYQDGDIMFHTGRSAQSEAVQRATKSRYSHVGIVFIKDRQVWVYEAVGPVKLTPVDEWIKHGEDQHYVVKRLKNADQVLTRNARSKMQEVGETFQGKSYDILFEWSDDKIYCSELVWKIYKRALDIEVGKLQTISEFDLSDPIVQAKVQERWGGPPPPDEIVISPAAIFNSDNLVTVKEG